MRKLGKKKKSGKGKVQNKKKRSATSLSYEELYGYKPNIVVVMLDDLGYYDVGYVDDARTNAKAATPHITKLAKDDGIILDRHYAHWHCSPSRRSFFTGRLPIRTEEALSQPNDDHVDIRWTWISEKLKMANYKTWFFGKGHTGYRSIQHLPRYQGFDNHIGLLSGLGSYRNSFGWKNYEPNTVGLYSTRLFGNLAVNSIEDHIASGSSDPFFLFLAFQTPHTPLDEPDPDKYPAEEVYKFPKKNMGKLDKMMWSVDVEMKRLTRLLKDNGLWDNTFFLFLSDNGGTVSKSTGSNFPLRGEKSTSFEGSMRVVAFVSGGFIPEHLRGTRNGVVTHIVDWYATFCYLAGVDDDDSSPTQILYPNLDSTMVDPLNPAVYNTKKKSYENLWGDAYPNHDSVNILSHLLYPDGLSSDAAHKYLVISAEAIIAGDFKLIVAQPCVYDEKSEEQDCKVKDNKDMYGWIRKNGQWTSVPENENYDCLKIWDQRDTYPDFQFDPCLFNLKDDLKERNRIVNQPDKVRELWKALNDTLVYQYNTLILGKTGGLSPSGCLGRCDSIEFARAMFKVSDEEKELPICGLDDIGIDSVQYC